jgi:drug/metabolite transporter (DMT)-like permease
VTDQVPFAVVAAVLAAAVLHATWNAIAHGSADRLVGFVHIGVAATVFGAVLVAFAGLPPADGWRFLAVSALLHVGYQLLLLRSYQLGEFSQVYPLARGTSPWVVALVSIVVLGQRLPWIELLGVLVVSVGLLSLVFLGGRPARDDVPALGTAFATGLVIAGYTVVDGVGVHHVPLLAYFGWLFLLQGPAVPLLAVALRGRALRRQLRPGAVVGLVGGVVSLMAYGLVLWAQTRGALAPIAALRETSIVIGAVIGAVLFGEKVGYRRAAAAAVVLVGIVLVTLP